ncbi:UNVERIFIED_CONTAM: hypothetical protein PYX00_002979 [Menopon gallinae]|uniref:dipeptidase E n=1 Tax=Menopon gallinae TaxID=328185 RepID=A0AAW2HYV9_9NEOP
MAEKRRLLLLSTSRIYGTEMLDFAANTVREFLNKSKVKSVLFVPYASFDYIEYTNLVRDAFARNKLEFRVTGIHEMNDPKEAVRKAEAIYIGGGNTFLLLNTLYKVNIVELIRNRVMKEGMPYIGSSAGTNVATVNICTTNDMPIIEVPTLNAISLVPFNINPHYLDPDPNSTHMGETREQRIKEYQKMPTSYSVVGLREGSLINVEGNKALLIGKPKARIFFKEKDPVEYPEGSDLSFLLK